MHAYLRILSHLHPGHANTLALNGRPSRRSSKPPWCLGLKTPVLRLHPLPDCTSHSRPDDPHRHRGRVRYDLPPHGRIGQRTERLKGVPNAQRLGRFVHGFRARNFSGAYAPSLNRSASGEPLGCEECHGNATFFAISGCGASRSVSRVLSRSPKRFGGNHSSGTPLARTPLATYPNGDPKTGPRALRHAAVPIRSCSRWGLPCASRCRAAGGLLPHPFTLTPSGADCFLWHYPLRRAITRLRRPLAAIAFSWSPDFPPPRPFGPCGGGCPTDWPLTNTPGSDECEALTCDAGAVRDRSHQGPRRPGPSVSECAEHCD